MFGALVTKNNVESVNYLNLLHSPILNSKVRLFYVTVASRDLVRMRDKLRI
jgi:hypothetical protein